MRSAQQRPPGRRRVVLHVNCGQFDRGRLALLSGRFDSTVDAVDDLRQPGTTGTVGMAPRMTKAFVQPVKCADPVVFAVAKRRLAPMSNEVWSVRRLPLRLVH